MSSVPRMCIVSSWVVKMDASVLTVTLKPHAQTHVRYWTVVAARDLAEAEAYPSLPYRPQKTRTKGSVTTRFIDERGDGLVLPYFMFLTEAWWNETFPGNTTFKAFKDSGVAVMSTTLGIMAGLLPHPPGVPM